MILLFINSSAVYALEEDKFHDNPIQVFDAFYTAKGLMLFINFSDWLNKYIIPEDANDLSEKHIKKIIRSTLTSNEILARNTLKLYPYQFLLNEDNWFHIKEFISFVYTNKYTREFENLEFDKFSQFIDNNIGTVINV